jgi:predicted RNA-binding Zn ribbon-like protein
MVTSTAASVRRSDPDYTFDFCGGHLAIDFTNTVGSRGDVPEEHLRTFGDLAAWADARGVLSHADAQRLCREASRRPAAAHAALARALTLREALYRVIAAAAAAHQPSAADLGILNAHVRTTLSRLRLASRNHRLALVDDGDNARTPDEAVLSPVVRAAVELLTSDAITRVRLCADESCGWLFLDTTRSHTRRWCDMKSCGNRSKVRRFRHHTE